MFFNLPFNLVTCILFLCLLLLPVKAEQLTEKSYFNAKPKKCVALRKGRECLADITFSWKTLTLGDYCLLDQQGQKIIQCWQESTSGHHQLSFSSEKSLHFLLIEKLTKKVVMESKVEVSWVYKTKHKKRRWRLF
jgi:hypothetical protein